MTRWLIALVLAAACDGPAVMQPDLAAPGMDPGCEAITFCAPFLWSGGDFDLCVLPFPAGTDKTVAQPYFDCVKARYAACGAPCDVVDGGVCDPCAVDCSNELQACR